MAEQQTKKTFNVGAFLADQGFELAGVDDKGAYKVRDDSGAEKTLNVNAMLKDLGVDASKFNLQFNTPEAPVDSSPVSLVDRAKLALGNTRGSINYLKNKFDDVSYNEENGLVVKKAGVWHKVDQSSMDPWELSKDIVEGAVGLIPGAVGAGVGAAKGALAGGSAGTLAGAAGGAVVAGPMGLIGGGAVGGSVGAVAGGIVGAGTGGAAAGAATRSVLGRLAGTYDPGTPEEELRDISWDFLLNAGGQAVAVGTKPTLQMFGKAIKNIKKAAGSTAAAEAANGTVDVLTDVMGRTTGMGPVNMRTLVDETDDVVKSLGWAKHGARSENDIVVNLRQDSLNKTSEILTRAPKVLTKKFGELVDDLTSSVPKDFAADIGGVVGSAQRALEEKGYGSILTKGGISGGQDYGINRATHFVVSNGDGAGQVFNKETKAALDEMAEVINKYADKGEIRGPGAARMLMDIKRDVNATARNIIESTSNETVVKFVNDFRAAFAQSVGDAFYNAREVVTNVAQAPSYLKTAAPAKPGKAELNFLKQTFGLGAGGTDNAFTYEARQAGVAAKAPTRESVEALAGKFGGNVSGPVPTPGSHPADLIGRTTSVSERPDLLNKYLATSNLYEEYADAVSMARSKLDGENLTEVLLNKLTQGQLGANQTYKNMTNKLAELLGDEGQSLFKAIRVNEAASAAARKLPKWTLGSIATSGLGAGALASGVVSAPVAAGLALQASPRFVLKEIQYAKQINQFMKSLPNSSKVQWLQNPNLVRETFKYTTDMAMAEDQLQDDLLKQGGVK